MVDDAETDMEVVIDDEGRLAKEYGVRTSGHALIYGPGGRLLFSGGLSPSRSASPTPQTWDWNQILLESPTVKPVLGCPLFDGDDGD